MLSSNQPVEPCAVCGAVSYGDVTVEQNGRLAGRYPVCSESCGVNLLAAWLFTDSAPADALALAQVRHRPLVN